MNPTQNIMVFDMPRCVRNGFLSLQSKLPDPSIADGNIVSEVGTPILIKEPWYNTPFLAYSLRKKRKYVLPDHVYGKAYLGNTFAALQPIVISLPAVGTTQIVQPVVTLQQLQIIDLYTNIQASYLWIVHIPSPLGVGVWVEVFAPEVDTTTKTRSVRFKPAGCNTIAVYLPWSNDLSVVGTATGRTGQSGGAIGIRVIEDNTTDQVNTPLNVTLYQVTYDIGLTGLRVADSTGEQVVGLNFIPATPPSIQGFVEHADDGDASVEVQAEGVADIPTQIAIDATPATEIAPEAEKPVGKPILPKKARATKNQTGIPGARWFEAAPVTVNTGSLMTWTNLTIDPYSLTPRGENISLAYRRNVWVTGSMKAGYNRTLRIKVVVSRPPSISGLIEFWDSRNNSSVYFVEFGGNVEFDLVPRHHSGVNVPARPRYPNNRYLRTDEAQCDWRYRLTGINRTSDVADINIRLLVRVGNSMFDVPTKPKAQTTIFHWLVEEMKAFVEQKDESTLMYTEMSRETIPGYVWPIDSYERRLEYCDREPSDCVDINNPERKKERFRRRPILIEHGDDEGDDDVYDSENFVAPRAGEGSYEGEVNAGEAFDEYIDQDDFAVEVFNGNLPVGDIVTVPLNLAVMPDLSGAGGMSTMAQKFERNAHIVPSGRGNLGPMIGKYVIELRLPTTISGSISHVSLPGDMTDEAAAFAFGLSNILGMATSAIQGVGGPLINAAISAGRAIFETIKGIGGKDNKVSNSDTSNLPTLSGPIDVSRFINFLKPIAANELADPTFGQLLIQARDFIGSTGEPIENIPARVWAKMNSQVERTLFDRTVLPINTMVNEVHIPYDRWGSIIDRFGAHPDTLVEGTHQNQCWMKFVTLIRKRAMKKSVVSLTLNEVLKYEVLPEDITAYELMISTRQLNFDPEPPLEM